MNLKAKPYEEMHKAAAQSSLAARIATLQSEGINEKVIQKDTVVRKFKAEVRKAKRRLTQVAALEKLKVEKEAHKAEKIAAAKASQATAQAPKKAKPADAAPKKAKKAKEKKPAAAE